MALITAAQARLYIPGLTGTGEDTNLNTLVTAAGAAIAAWCGWPPASAGSAESMESATHTRYYTGDGSRDLVVDLWPITAIASIYDDPLLVYGSDTLVAAADYSIIDGARGLVRLTSTAAHGAWSTSKDAIKVAGTFGFSTTPGPVVQACAMTVKAMWDLRHTLNLETMSQSGQTTSFGDPELIPRQARDLLRSYVLPRALL